MADLTAEIQELLQRRFQVVTGKGGVGRTLIASSLASMLAQLGKKTLLLEVNAPNHCARVLGTDAIVGDPQQVSQDLYLCSMNPEDALREYALMILKFPALYRLVFENPLVKYFLRSIPSLGEVTMLGKAWFHATERDENGESKYDHVIVDAPATGHALTFLSVARVVERTVPRGPMRTEAGKMAALIEDHENSCAHVVFTPEEMPVTEGLELSRKLQENVGMKLGVYFMNKICSEEPGDRELALVDEMTDEQLYPYVAAGHARRSSLENQENQLERLRAQSQNILSVTELRSVENDVKRVSALSSHWRGLWADLGMK